MVNASKYTRCAGCATGNFLMAKARCTTRGRVQQGHDTMRCGAPQAAPARVLLCVQQAARLAQKA
jgi:hypothetical protein